MAQSAIFTIVQDDAVYLEKWLEAHTPHFSRLYILNHSSQEEATARLLKAVVQRDDVEVLTVPYELTYDTYWLVAMTRCFQAYLLNLHELVAFTAADEYLVSTDDQPLLDKLRWLLQQDCLRSYVRGYEVLQQQDQALQPWRPWLAQRRYWIPTTKYTKPLITVRQPLYWSPAWQTASNVPATPEHYLDGVALVHTHRIDFDLCLQRHRRRAARRWEPNSRLQGPFRHNLLEDPEQLAEWLHHSPVPLEAIPERIRTRL